MRRPWQYVRDAWRQSELTVKDSDNLKIWIETVREAMIDANKVGMEMADAIRNVISTPGKDLATELLEAPELESYKCFQFPHGTAQYWEEKSGATGKVMKRMYTQVIDDYHYQREWSLRQRHRAGNSKAVYWESHIYRHPGIRCIVEPQDKAAENLLAKYLEYCEKWPSLLFNARSERQAANAGFVDLALILHEGALPSVRIF